jgi:hypothetical protein
MVLAGEPVCGEPAVQRTPGADDDPERIRLEELEQYVVKNPGNAPNTAKRWYVVRDIGTALGETGRLNPQRNDPALFEQTRFINGVKHGAVDFNYHGRHQELANHIAAGRSAMDVRSARAAAHRAVA